jgi:hypothetical protein
MTDSARRFFDPLHWACVNMRASIEAGNGVREVCRIFSQRLLEERDLVLSPERLRKWYYKFEAEGPKGLINGRLMGKPPEKRTVSPAIIDEFWAAFLGMKDKASKEGAWRILMARLVSGQPMECGMTWMRLYMQLHPAADVPPACPWSHHNPPPGWSLGNFTTQQVPSAVAQVLALRGMGAAKALLAKTAGVRIDWASLRVGECLMIDDHDVDFRCWVQGQMVRLRLIVLREVRTRRHLAYCVRPRTKDDDGTERSISRRDVQHLLAGFLWNFGLPRDYPCYLHCENAAAAVTREFEEMLHRVTGGRLLIDRTALYSGVVKMSGYKQSGGTPTGKAIIESGFRLFDRELCHIRGATGSNYTVKPEEHQGRLNASKKMLDRVRELPVTRQNELAEAVKSGEVKFPFASLWEAHEEIALAMQRMDARDWHEMEGFLQVHEFRTSPDSAIYYPLNRELAELRSNEDQAIIKEFLCDTPEVWQKRMIGWGRNRAESSAECWLRLASKVPFVSISRASLFELLLDGQSAKWPGTGEIRLEIAGEKIAFRGRIEAEANQVLRFRYNADAPRAVWVQDHAGRVLGTLARSERLSYHDAEGIKDAAAFKASALGRALHEVRGLELSNRDEIREIQDDANLAALMSAFEGEHARPVPVAAMQCDTSSALLAAVEATPESLPDEADSWRELARARRASK